jgi:eukaryotic-like serine/threonine-protein kinase
VNPERLALVEEIFLAAAGCQGPARDELIRARCGDDAALRAEVESLLSHDDGTEDQVLDVPLVAPAVLPRNLVESEGPALTPGTRIGAYTIEGVLGTGGMGVVYVAHQESPRRTVALKLLRPGVAAGALLRRIELEAELLGRLKHPGIAQIYESGRADYGMGPQPFFAMELVDGPPLNRFVQDRGLSTHARLELVVKVCDAVEHAHQKGVIHRDLKPGNILVDGTGQPKILDFGVARATDADLRVTTLRTDVGQLIGTLPYMSPEQVQGAPEEMDTRSDVYALGVIMYELLTGRLPHQLDSRSIPDAARIIREVEPERLGSVNRSLRGDVETIVAKAMDKSRERRYQSASALAEDIRRCLAGEPIEAKKDSAIYLLRKHLRRYRALVAGVCLLVIGLSAFSVYASRQAELNRRLVLSEHETAVRAEFLRTQAERQAEQLRRGAYFTRIGYAQAALAVHDADRMTRVLADCPEDLRGWEWRFLKRHSDNSEATVVCRPQGFTTATLSGDGTRFASWQTGVKDLAVWDCATRTQIASIPVAPAISAAALDGAGGRGVVALTDGTAELWPVGGSGPIWKRGLIKLSFRSCEFSADGQTIALAGQDPSALLIDTGTGAVIQRFPCGSQDAYCVGLSPDGRWAATGNDQGEVRIFDATTGDVSATFQAHRSEVRSLAFSPDSTQLASCGNDTSIRMWRLGQRGWRVGPRYQVHGNKVAALAFSPDGLSLASGGTESTIQVVALESGEIVRSLHGHTQTINMIRYTDAGRTLVTSAREGRVKWWDLSDPWEDPRTTAAGMVNGAAITADGTRLYTAGEPGPLQAWAFPALTEVAGFKGPTVVVRDLAVSQDGKLLATSGPNREVGVWDAQTGAPVRRIPALAGAPYSVEFTPEGRLVATWLDQRVTVHDPVSGTLFWERSLGGRAGALAVEPGGARFAVAVERGPIAIIDARDGTELKRLPGHTRMTTGVAFLGQTGRLASCGDDALTRVWDLASARELCTLRGHSVAVRAVSVSPDLSRIVTGSDDNTVRLWDAATGDEILTLRHHTGGVFRAFFSPEGERIISAGNDRSIRVWSSTASSARR